MIYDCFSFFNELDVLELRLEILSDVVDKFVLVEATKTHSNKHKPLYFSENKERFAKWSDKIIHIIVDTYPEFRTSWTYENYQRNCIMEGLKDCNDNDVIIISDVDEIPNPNKILEASKLSGIKCLEMRMHNYYLNYWCYTSPKWSSAKILTYGDLRKPLDENLYSVVCLPELNEGTTPTKVRMYRKCIPVSDAGWHFSYLGGWIRSSISYYPSPIRNLTGKTL